MYKISCNACQCGEDNALVCTKMACLDKETMENLKKKKELSLRQGNKRDSEDRIPDLPKGECIAGELYKRGCEMCFCNDKKEAVCSKKPCKLKLSEKQMKDPEHFPLYLETKDCNNDLPSLPHMASECQKGKRYRIDCNICVCLSNGNLACTKKLCVTPEGLLKAAIFQHSGNACKKGKPMRIRCIKCDCVNGKTECLAIPGCKEQKPHFSCNSGDNVKLSLDTTKDKCIPKMIYRLHCNSCYCQEDGQLRCTQKFCLNYSESKKLKKQRLYLEKYGL